MSNLLVLMMAAMLLWVSIQAIRGAVQLNRTYELVPNRFIYPGNCKPELCLDPAGFIRFIVPRLWGFGLIGLALCALMLANEFWGILNFLPAWFSNGASLFLFLPIFAWYIIFINKAAKRFW
jgi:hypothetical protein